MPPKKAAGPVGVEAEPQAMPLDLVKLALDTRVFVKLKGGRELRGTLHAYDQHWNLVLGDAEETHTITTFDDKTYDEETKQVTRRIEMVFVRGDSIVLISPPLRS
eukprot:TRINITY_DN70001_c0_g1_i1.p2 TRINITY_DN70001_c0_g1~~TRINITY_DN70001_c0_g1_i1.p2  ORF type:complete len:105 (-),score=14.38 TRINITY_DN70001_c0_g1_i1:418-732(-)